MAIADRVRMPARSTAASRCRPSRSAALILVLVVTACSSNGSPSSFRSKPASSPTTSNPTGRHVVVTVGRARWHLPEPLSRMVVLPDRGGALLAGGLTGSDTSSNVVYRVDLVTGRLRDLGTVPEAFHDAAGATIAGRAVIFGGGSTSSSASIESFDVKTRLGRTIGHLPEARSDLSTVTIAGRVYLVGGYTGTTQLPDVLETTNGTSFTTVAALPVPVRYAAVVAVGSTIWVFGGEHDGRPVRDIQRIDTTTGNATIVGRLPSARSDAAAMVVDDRVLVAGGRGPGGLVVATVDEFDPQAFTLRSVVRLSIPVANTAVTVAGNTAYLIGGESQTPIDAVQTITVRSVPDLRRASPSPQASSSIESQALGEPR
jgi:hypothetical protein